MDQAEVFNPYQLKTKLSFMAFQLAYTALTLLPVPLLHRCRWLSTATLLAVFSIATYNGGEYYIEVFSRRYYRQFGGSEGQLGDEAVRDADDEPEIPVPSGVGVAMHRTDIRGACGTESASGEVERSDRSENSAAGLLEPDDTKERWQEDKNRWEPPPPILSDDDNCEDDDISTESDDVDDVQEEELREAAFFSHTPPLTDNSAQKMKRPVRRRRGHTHASNRNQVSDGS
jgi:hypothetical protein